MRLSQFAAIGLLILSIVIGGSSANPATADTLSGVDEILVKFKPTTPAGAIAEAHRQRGGQEKATVRGIGVRVVRVPAGSQTASLAAYRNDPNVLYAEPNGVYGGTWLPNDPLFAKQWQYKNSTGADIQAVEAWNITAGSSSVAIAVLDTGISPTHPDLSGKIGKAINFTSSKTVNDVYGHGTHVAGSIAALTNNENGVAGTCPACTLYNVKVLGDDNFGYWSWIADGITWAADNGAQVINLSLGGTSGSKTLESAVEYAWKKGAIVVAAAGNNGSNKAFYPAYYTNAIAVAATDAKDAKASFSNYGSWVDVAAPGANITSTLVSGSYGTKSGTSMATPHVSGLAGLLFSSGVCGSDNACVRQRIEAKADAVPGSGQYWTYGRINAYKSLTTETTTPSPDFTLSASPSSLSFTSPGTATFAIEASTSGGFSDPVTLSVSAPGADTIKQDAPTLSATNPDVVVLAAYSTPGTYTITVTGTGGGITRTSQVNVTVKASDTSLPSLSTQDVSVVEGRSKTTEAQFEVTLSAASTQFVTVQYSVGGGTATPNKDYRTKSGQLTFEPGATSKTISISVIGDRALEPDETFLVKLTSPVGATVADGEAVGTILNDD